MNTLVKRLVNGALAPLGGQVVPRPAAASREATLRRQLAAARVQGADPNDLAAKGEDEDAPAYALEVHYLPHVAADKVVLEIGPGLGGVARAVLPRCKELLLVEESAAAAGWLGEYLKGQGAFRLVRQDCPWHLPGIGAAVADVILAPTAFRGLDLDQTYWLLDACQRALRVGGVMAFSFANLASKAGGERFLVDCHKYLTDGRCPVRYHLPEAVRRVAAKGDFEVLRLTTPETSRWGYAELKRIPPLTTLGKRKEEP